MCVSCGVKYELEGFKWEDTELEGAMMCGGWSVNDGQEGGQCSMGEECEWRPGMPCGVTYLPGMVTQLSRMSQLTSN